MHVAKESGYLIYFSSLWSGRVVNMTMGRLKPGRGRGQGQPAQVTLISFTPVCTTNTAFSETINLNRQKS